MKVSLKDKLIPLNKDGVPAFTRLFPDEEGDKTQQTALSNVFTADEIVELVNRALYQLDYQKQAHRKRQQAQRDFEAPIKEALKLLYPGVSWMKATQQQLAEALAHAYPNSKPTAVKGE